MKLQMIATCLFGLEKLLGEELDALGAHRTDTMDGRVSFEGDEHILAAANIRLRCAERVYISLGSFEATSFEQLFEGCRALPWEEWIGREDAFPVKGHSIRSALFSVPDCQSILKKAVVERLRSVYGAGWLPETGIKYQIEFFLFKDRVTLMIDSSGVPLHKRGYRPAAGEAPLRETLEAAMIATRQAPGIDRRFAAERFGQIEASVWHDERVRARSEILVDSGFEAYASDVDPEVLAVAKENAERAGVDDRIRFFVKNALDIRKENRRGTIVCNPPYGERLMTPEQVRALYRDMGKTFSALEPWQIYILTSSEEFERLYGRRADKVRKLYNGMIPCRLYLYFKPVAGKR